MARRHMHIKRIIARACFASALALSCFGVTDLAQAGPSQAELREARATFRAALALEAAGDFKAALVKFREVAEVRQTSQVMFHIAVCLEKLGRWTEALGTYRMAIDRATEEGAEDVVSSADEARKSLEARMPKIQVVRGKGAAG
ncbi:MAG: tetratricopeptide repeat protein, partial [Myxococcota bacterium]